MDETNERLDKLLNDPESMSTAGLIRTYLGQIEEAIARGVRQQKIIDSLGLKVTVETFRRTLFRVRREVKAASVETKTHGGTAPQTVVAEVAKDGRRVRNPGRLDGEEVVKPTSPVSTDPVGLVTKGRVDNPDTKDYFTE